MTTPEGSRFCDCGCGSPVSMRARYTAACKIRVKLDKQESVRSVPGRMSATPKKLAGDVPRVPVKRCKVCFDLPDRREAKCKGCGRAHAPERIGQ